MTLNNDKERREKMGDETSIKQLFQSMIPEQAGIIQGTVTSVSPLKIQAVNDAKLIIGAASVIIPRHLTDYTIKVTIPTSGGHTQYEGSGEHSHGNVTMTVSNALKTGDMVHMLSVQNGKKYYVLGRV
jgi:hypothetical protein